MAKASSKKQLLMTIFRSGSYTLALLALSAQHRADALNLYDGSYNDQQLTINLETTVEYSNIYRVNDPSALLAGPHNANGNDGDSSFRHGFVDNSFDVLPVFDLKFGDYGVHVSGQAYLDTPYLGKNQNNQPGTFNPYTTASSRDFTSATRNVNGENAQWLDAFAYGTKYFGENNVQNVTLKVGRQTLLWGQSLFLTNSGIAAGQAPVDIIKAQSLPNPQAQQIFSPVGQAVVTYQPNQVLTFQGYYQFEWEPDTFQGVGSYFSSTDLFDKGGQRALFPVAPGVLLPAYRGRDNRPNHNGQFGVSVQATLGNYDLGLYALRFDAKTPEVYVGLPLPSQPANSIGTYYLIYPRDTAIYGTSISTTIGPVSVGGEISGRTNMPLVSNVAYLFLPGNNNGNASSHPLYAVGDTSDAQASLIYLSPGVPFDPGGVTVEGEIQASHVLEVTANKAAVTGGRDSTAGEFDIEVIPTYNEVLPNLQIQFPIGVAYNLFGRSQIDVTENHGTGILDFGVTATYKATWIAGLNYQDYIGAPNPNLAGDASTADRGFVSFSIQHTF